MIEKKRAITIIWVLIASMGTAVSVTQALDQLEVVVRNVERLDYLRQESRSLSVEDNLDRLSQNLKESSRAIRVIESFCPKNQAENCAGIISASANWGLGRSYDVHLFHRYRSSDASSAHTWLLRAEAMADTYFRACEAATTCQGLTHTNAHDDAWRVYDELGRYTDAANSLEYVIERKRVPMNLYNLAQIFVKLGRIDGARRLHRELRVRTDRLAEMLESEYPKIFR